MAHEHIMCWSILGYLRLFFWAPLLYLGPALRVKASGNAYPVPLMISVLYPIMAMLQKKIPRNRSKQASLESQVAVACCSKFETWMTAFKEEAISEKTKGGKAMKSMKAMKAMKAIKAMKAMKMKKPAGKSTKTTTKKKATGSKVKKTQAKTNRDSRRRNRYQYRFLSSSSSNWSWEHGTARLPDVRLPF